MVRSLFLPLLLFPACLLAQVQYSPAWLRPPYSQLADKAALHALFIQGQTWYYNRQVDSLEQAATALQAFAQKTQDTTLQQMSRGHASYLRSLKSFATHELPGALQASQQAIAAYERPPQYRYLYAAYTLTANVYNGLGQRDEAVGWSRNALQAAQRSTDSATIAKAWNNIAVCFFHVRTLHDSCWHYYRLALGYTMRHGTPTAQIQLLGNLANLSVADNRPTVAIAYALRALSLMTPATPADLRLSTSLSLADAYIVDGQVDEALDVLYPILAQTRGGDFAKVRLTALHAMAKAYTEKENKDSINYYYGVYYDEQERMISEEYQAKIARLSVEYDRAKGEQEHLKATTRSERMLYGVGGMIVLVVLLLAFLWYRRRVQAALAALQQEVEELRRLAAEEKERATQRKLDNDRIRRLASQSEQDLLAERMASKSKTLLQLREILRGYDADASTFRSALLRMIEAIENDEA